MAQGDYLRGVTDTELRAIVAEAEARADIVDSQTRAAINDELRRRGMPTMHLVERRFR